MSEKMDSKLRLQLMMTLLPPEGHTPKVVPHTSIREGLVKNCEV